MKKMMYSFIGEIRYFNVLMKKLKISKLLIGISIINPSSIWLKERLINDRQTFFLLGFFLGGRGGGVDCKIRIASNFDEWWWIGLFIITS